ncbi:sulfatase [Zavarzinella formosa]|uniref:sulfatase n=1 Tax=Zavarzinella formosa TaxID=360055 RepID=UPI0002F938D5|nr:sulfatase [Zavarzinella formosa]
MRRIFFTLTVLLMAASLSLAAPKRPNIIMIVGDDMGYGDIGVHGVKDIPTPNIDKLSKDGVRFTNGYVSGPYCSPTRAGLLTGRYQQRFGHEFNPGPKAEAAFGLSLKETTLPSRLKDIGYKTGMVGKWHLGFEDQFNPINRGFDEYFGFLGGAHDYFKNGMGQNAIVRGTKPVEEKEYLTDAFAREAVSFIEKNQKDPFFLYLTFNAVHTPLEASEKYLKRFESIKDEKRQKYAAMMSAMDDAIGQVLATVNKAGLEKDTLVAFISDNGGPPVNGSNNGPLHGFKATTWEGGVRVPYFIKWPAAFAGGRTLDHPVIQLDLHTTILNAAGAQAKTDWKLDGVNLLPTLTGEKKDPPHTALYWRFGAQVAIRAGDWKLVKANEPGSPVTRTEKRLDGAKLFNLADDIGEKTDLAAKNPEKVKELTELWEKWNAELVPPTWLPAPAAKKKNIE